MWSIEFCSDEALDEFDEMPTYIRGRLSKIIAYLKILGNELGSPHTEHLVDDLFEIRAKSKEGIGRSIYAYQKGKRIIILVTFVKKTQKTPSDKIELAKRRLKEWQDENP